MKKNTNIRKEMRGKRERERERERERVISKVEFCNM